MTRYTLHKEGDRLVALDTENGVGLKFKPYCHIGCQEPIYDERAKANPEELATLMRQLAEWLIAEHAELVYPENEYERLRLGRRIAQLRKEAGLTQTRLAEDAGLQQSHIARIEQGLYSIKYDTLSAIAKALGGKVDITKIKP